MENTGIGNVDSKYRFVILAAKRAKQLLKGAKPKIKGKSRNLIRIAQAEVKAGLIEYEILPDRKEDIPDAAEHIFVGDGIPAPVEDVVETDVVVGKGLPDDETAEDIHEDVEEDDEEEAEPEMGNDFKEEKDE